MQLEELGLTVKTYNCLRRAGFNTVEDIKDRLERDGDYGLMTVRGLGRRSLDEIKEKLEGMK